MIFNIVDDVKVYIVKCNDVIVNLEDVFSVVCIGVSFENVVVNLKVNGIILFIDLIKDENVVCEWIGS